MNVNFEYYKIFFYVAKYHNFTKAAHVLGNSQPNVTRAMNCLEQQINTLLFVRTNRGVELTPEGEKLYIRVSAAMAQIFEAEEELSDSMSLSHGSISIGASETALNIFLLDKLKSFHMMYQGIRINEDFIVSNLADADMNIRKRIGNLTYKQISFFDDDTYADIMPEGFMQNNSYGVISGQI